MSVQEHKREHVLMKKDIRTSQMKFILSLIAASLVMAGGEFGDDEGDWHGMHPKPPHTPITPPPYTPPITTVTSVVTSTYTTPSSWSKTTSWSESKHPHSWTKVVLSTSVVTVVPVETVTSTVVKTKKTVDMNGTSKLTTEFTVVLATMALLFLAIL